jgi:hypothetical protein
MVHSQNRTHTQIVVLPPDRQAVTNVFRKVENDCLRYHELLAEMQRFRGSVYMEDGALQASDLTRDGRHRQPIDDRSWHVLSLDESERVVACLRYSPENHARGFDDLWVRHAALSRSPLAHNFRFAVESEMQRARKLGLGFGEVGGWAVAQQFRCTLEPLRIILATYGLLQLLGGCVGVATATFRHKSAAILRRIGLSSLSSCGAELPPYFDSHYCCEMEVLRFDSRFPNAKYRESVNEFSDTLKGVPLICREDSRPASPQKFRRGDLPIGIAAVSELMAAV